MFRYQMIPTIQNLAIVLLLYGLNYFDHGNNVCYPHCILDDTNFK